MRLLLLAAGFLAALGLAGCLSTHHEDYANSSTLGFGPNGVESASSANYNVRNWSSPWLGQPDGARPGDSLRGISPDRNSRSRSR